MRNFTLQARLIKHKVLGEAGSALVETALTFPVLIAMLLGSMELGQVAYASIETMNAARAGAQYAAMNGGGFNDPSGISSAAQQDAYDTYTPHPTKFAVTSSTPSCSCSDGVGTCSASGAVGSSPGTYSCTSGKPIVTVTVQTTATYSALFSVPGFTNSFTLHGYSQQEVLQ